MSTVLVADIGGSSSRWLARDANGSIRSWEGLPGFNPAVGDPQAFTAAIRDSVMNDLPTPDAIFVYGAGCGTVERAARMEDALRGCWPQAVISVSSDLVGAALGLTAPRPGLVLILGTGMNAGYFDGRELTHTLPSLGYILGDEGSGADIGKHVVMDAIHDRVPAALRSVILPPGFDLPLVVDEVYRGRAPQAWLASFAKPLSTLIDEPYVDRLICDRFSALADRIEGVFPATERAIAVASGSVALGFRTILVAVLGSRGIAVTDVQPSPMEGLLTYHSLRSR